MDIEETEGLGLMNSHSPDGSASEYEIRPYVQKGRRVAYGQWNHGVRIRIVILLFALLTLTANAQAPFAIGQVKYGGGGDWYSSTDSIANWLREVRTRVGIPTERAARVVTITEKELYKTPFLYLNGHGNLRFTDAEATSLRNFLTRGGFLFVNDDYGLDASFRREIARVFPNKRLEPIPATHAVYHCFYDLAGLPKVHEHDGQPAQGFGIFHEGRMVVFYAWSADIGDGLEAQEVHKDPPGIREAAIKMAVNLAVYALTR